MTDFDLAVKAVRMFATMHPRPSHVTQTQACEMLDVSQPTLRKMINQGKIKRNALGMIPTVEVDRLLQPLGDA